MSLSQLKANKITIKEIYLPLLQTNFDRPLTLPTFAKLVRSIKDDCKQSAIGHLFRLLDRDQRGTIHLGELMDFSLTYDRDMDILYYCSYVGSAFSAVLCSWMA